MYLYGFAAQEEKRKKLPSIRAGEYEKMSEKVQEQTLLNEVQSSVTIMKHYSFIWMYRNLISYSILMGDS